MEVRKRRQYDVQRRRWRVAGELLRSIHEQHVLLCLGSKRSYAVKVMKLTATRFGIAVPGPPRGSTISTLVSVAHVEQSAST